MFRYKSDFVQLSASHVRNFIPPSFITHVEWLGEYKSTSEVSARSKLMTDKYRLFQICLYIVRISSNIGARYVVPACYSSTATMSACPFVDPWLRCESHGLLL